MPPAVTDRCVGCGAPADRCFCDALLPVPCGVRVVVVRHVRERFKVSATGHLAARLVGGEVIEHGVPGAAASMPSLGPLPLLLFPHGSSSPPPQRPSALVVLDGTWSQATQMRRRVPGLAGIPVLSLPPPESRWRMREQHLTEGMSTLEAVAAALALLGEDQAAAALQASYRRMATIWRDLRRLGADESATGS